MNSKNENMITLINENKNSIVKFEYEVKENDEEFIIENEDIVEYKANETYL